MLSPTHARSACRRRLPGEHSRCLKTSFFTSFNSIVKLPFFFLWLLWASPCPHHLERCQHLVATNGHKCWCEVRRQRMQRLLIPNCSYCRFILWIISAPWWMILSPLEWWRLATLSATALPWARNQWRLWRLQRCNSGQQARWRATYIRCGGCTRMTGQLVTTQTCRHCAVHRQTLLAYVWL